MGTGSHIELRAVQRTGEESSAKAPARKLCVAVRAVVGHRMELAGHSADYEAVLADFGERPKLPVSQIAQIAELNVVSRHHDERTRG